MKLTKKIDLLEQMAMRKAEAIPRRDPSAEAAAATKEKAMNEGFELMDALVRTEASQLLVPPVLGLPPKVNTTERVLIAAAAACAIVLRWRGVVDATKAVEAITEIVNLCDADTAAAAMSQAGAAVHASLEARLDEAVNLSRIERDSVMRCAMHVMRSTGSVDTIFTERVASHLGLAGVRYIF